MTPPLAEECEDTLIENLLASYRKRDMDGEVPTAEHDGNTDPSLLEQCLASIDSIEKRHLGDLDILRKQVENNSSLYAEYNLPVVNMPDRLPDDIEEVLEEQSGIISNLEMDKNKTSGKIRGINRRLAHLERLIWKRNKKCS